MQWKFMSFEHSTNFNRIQNVSIRGSSSAVISKFVAHDCLHCTVCASCSKQQWCCRGSLLCATGLVLTVEWRCSRKQSAAQHILATMAWVRILWTAILFTADKAPVANLSCALIVFCCNSIKCQFQATISWEATVIHTDFKQCIFNVTNWLHGYWTQPCYWPSQVPDISSMLSSCSQ